MSSGRPPNELMYLIPAYNEEATLGSLVEEIRKYALAGEIVVVDDGSTDKTSEVAVSLGVTLLKLPVNLGIGGAVQTGLIYAKRHGFQYLVRLDADGQHDPKDVSSLLKLLYAKDADLVIGSRFLKDSDGYHSSPGRVFGITLLRWLNFLVTGLNIRDVTSGFVALNHRMIRYLADNIPVDFPEPETIVLATRGHFHIREVAITARPRQGGTSSIRWRQSIMYMYKVCLAILLTASKRSLPTLGEK